MLINWPNVLNEAGVKYSGSADNLRLQCPWCREGSNNFGIWTGGYHCFRNTRHGGADPMWLLRALLPGRSRADLLQIMRDQSVDAPPPRVVTEAVPDLSTKWAKFRLATDSDRCLDYLYARGFTEPEVTARQFDLRYAPTGYWSARLLIPFVRDGRVVSWTGRAMSSALAPRYDRPPGTQSGLLYTPSAMRAIAVLSEGPLDALKIQVAADTLPIAAIGLLGLANTGDDTMRALSELTINCHSIYICLDAGIRDSIGAWKQGDRPSFGQTASQFHAIKMVLARLRRSLYIGRLALPGAKDPGEMSLGDLRNLLIPITKAEGTSWRDGSYPS